jgi:hypothetical protein
MRDLTSSDLEFYKRALETNDQGNNRYKGSSGLRRGGLRFSEHDARKRLGNRPNVQECSLRNKKHSGEVRLRYWLSSRGEVHSQILCDGCAGETWTVSLPSAHVFRNKRKVNWNDRSEPV